MTDKIQILVVDDHAIMREGIRLMLETEEEFEVIGEAANGEQAVELTRMLKPDIILMDLIMPVMDGVEAIREIMQQEPASRILVLTSSDKEKDIVPSIRLGALGYILKESHPQDLINAIRNVFEGKPVLQPSIMAKLMGEISTRGAPGYESLSDREMQVLKLVAVGHSNQYIADQLEVSSRTIGAHISHILKKLDLQNRTQIALYAIREGLIDPPTGS